jgi:hypothetical protein
MGERLKNWLGKTLLKDEAVANRRQEGAQKALWILAGINLLNFADRYVPCKLDPCKVGDGCQRAYLCCLQLL